MRFTLALAALAGLASAAPQGVTASLTPDSSSPSGCSSTYDNGAQFQIGIVNVTGSAKLKRQATPDTVPGHSLYLTLSDGTLKDQGGNTGYIAANGQLQFDPNQPQTGAQITTGWSACPNNTLALSSTVFYECLSGSFYNLYDRDIGSVCYQVNLAIIGGTGAGPSGAATFTGVGASSSATAAPVSSAPATSVAVTTPAITSAVVTQVSDGQIQASSAVSAITQVTDGQIQAPTAVVSPVTQITDGQIQAPTNGTIAPYNPNGASGLYVSGSFAAAVAAVAAFLA